MNVSILAETLVREGANPSGDREAEPLATSRLREDKSINADNVSLHVYQRTTTVAGIDRSIGLDVHHGLVGIRLSSDRTDDAHGHRALQTFRAADGKNQLSLVHPVTGPERKRRKIPALNFDQSKINILVNSDQFCFERLVFSDG